MWGGTQAAYQEKQARAISIHPPRVGWDLKAFFSSVDAEISIHPPRVGWDQALFITPKTINISIHPPRVGWDVWIVLTTAGDDPFQSTHPVWGGTRATTETAHAREHFNPPTPCGVGLDLSGIDAKVGAFQSTHPVWGGTAPAT